MIQQNKQLRMENVLSLRRKMTQIEMQQEMSSIGGFLKKQGVSKSGPVVTATFQVEEQNGQQIMDIEILVPLDQPIEPSKAYTFKPIFNLVNALYIRHEGSPVYFQDTVNQLNEYINKNNLQVITATYSVMIKEAANEKELNDMIIDLYVGINTSIL